MILSSAKKYGLLRPAKSESVFDFGVQWSSITKIIMVASGIETDLRNIFFDGGYRKNPYIGYENKSMDIVVGNGLTGFSYSGITPDIVDGREFVATFSFDRPSYNLTVHNLWDEFWTQRIIYHKISFFDGEFLVSEFIPDITNSDRMYDVVKGIYITASIPGIYKLVEVN